MTSTLIVNLEQAVESVKLLSGPPDSNGQYPAGSAAVASETTTQQAATGQLCRTLQTIIDKLNQFCENLFSEHEQQIARLAVEISRKILAREIEQGNYEIETIIAEAIKNIPGTTELVVRLNPQDLAQCRRLQQNESTGPLAQLKLVADANVGLAECVVESPKGLIESRIEQHLEQVAKALEKAQ